MQVLENTKRDIEAKAGKMSDFLKMEYLESCLKKKLGIDVDKFCYTELSKLYASKNMYSEAGKYMSAAAEICATLKEKIQIYVNEAELWIKAGIYDRADYALRKAIEEVVVEREQKEIINTIKGFYKKQALEYERTNKNSGAAKIYEKLISLSDHAEQIELKRKLLVLYERLGKIREYMVLKKELGLE
jgi:hypothetical protein